MKRKILIVLILLNGWLVLIPASAIYCVLAGAVACESPKAVFRMLTDELDLKELWHWKAIRRAWSES